MAPMRLRDDPKAEMLVSWSSVYSSPVVSSGIWWDVPSVYLLWGSSWGEQMVRLRHLV